MKTSMPNCDDRLKVAVMALWISACSADSPEPLSDDAVIEGLSGLGDVQSFDAITENGRLELIYAKKNQNKKTTIEFVSREGDAGSWKKVILPIGRGKVISTRGNDIQMAVNGRERIAVVQQEGDLPGNGPLHVYASEDDGKHWRHLGKPVKNDASNNEAYPAIVSSHGAYTLAWLDDREENGNTQGLRAAISRDKGKSWHSEKTLDDATCTCCWIRMVRDDHDTLSILYRDHQPQDMSLIKRNQDGIWSQKLAVGQYLWDFNGCPHSGGGLAVAGKMMHTVVWTGQKELTGLHYLRSEDNGEHWKNDRIMDAGGRDGDIATDEDGQNILAAWIQRVGTRNRVTISHSRDAGIHWSENSWVSSENLNADHPRVLYQTGRFLILWTERDGDKEKKLTGLQVKK